MNFNDFTVAQLKMALRYFNLSVAGSKAEMIARLQSNDPEGEKTRKIIEKEEDKTTVRGEEFSTGSWEQNMPQNSVRKELWQKERELDKKELELMRRENEILRNMSPAITIAPEQPNMLVKIISDLLNEFDGTDNTYPIWEKQIRLLRNTYNLNDNSMRILIGAKLKGRALWWFHSRAEHIEMNCEELLRELKNMFDHRLS